MTNKRKQEPRKDYPISMAYPNSQIRIRELGKVTPITFPEDQLTQLKKVLIQTNTLHGEKTQ